MCEGGAGGSGGGMGALACKLPYCTMVWGTLTGLALLSAWEYGMIVGVGGTGFQVRSPCCESLRAEIGR
jgi:hypothetical protein